MEGTLLYSFIIKSSIHDYAVNFIDDLKKALERELVKGDFVVIDKKIEELYGSQINETIKNYGIIEIDATEAQKSYEGIIPVIKLLIDNGFRKNNRLLAIGGGITQDVTAFISSIMYRGVGWVYFPTTLLAQCDSCIGSKTSINFGKYKNQIGGFYPPNKILIYPSFIDTLSEREMKSGMGEMLHYFIVSGKKDYEMFEKHYIEAFTNKETLSLLISKSLEIKKKYIEVDEFDQNIRQVFNYGHSFGHAIESLTQYRIPHGIAVCFGIDIANFLSVKMGFINQTIRQEINEVILSITQNYSIKGIDLHLFLNALSKDKKNEGEKLGLILNKGYGNIFKNITLVDEQFVGWLKDYFENEIK
jgi:3-dehydroquinate synthase